MKHIVRHYALTGAGYLSCTVPPLVTLLQYIPRWREEGAVTLLSGIALSGFTIVLFIMVMMPVLKLANTKTKTPAPWKLWGIITIVAFSINRVIDSLIYVSLAAFIGCLIGALLFGIDKICDEYQAEKSKTDQAKTEE